MAVDLVELPLEDAMIVISERELSKIILDADNYEKLFWELLTLVMTVCGSVSQRNTIDGARIDVKKIENWIQHHYIMLRPDIPTEIKHLYLEKIAFPVVR